MNEIQSYFLQERGVTSGSPMTWKSMREHTLAHNWYHGHPLEKLTIEELDAEIKEYKKCMRLYKK
ncbi:hypothetical protein AGMMS49942_21180 [Spirochaetia bacterium]|nr:hypothetical protein AGMMS49942_21180 [Spirochaetia bacterium]